MDHHLGHRMDLCLTTLDAGDPTVVAVQGEIDVYTAPDLREHLTNLVHTGHHHLVVDLEQVDFLDSTGLAVFITVLRRLRPHGGSLRLVATTERILKVFRITGLTQVFPIHHSLAEALAMNAAATSGSPGDPGRAPAGTPALTGQRP